LRFVPESCFGKAVTMISANVLSAQTGKQPSLRTCLAVLLAAGAALLLLPGPQARDVASVLALALDQICSVAGSDPDERRDMVTPVTSYALPNVPGKRITVVKVSYPPGGFTPPHRHSGTVTAYVTMGAVRSQLGGGPIETFKAGTSFFEPPGSVHLVSENASATEPAELIAIFVADEGATLTTFLQ
jgi:quercetin dioxygenase-like cupin family protein